MKHRAIGAVLFGVGVLLLALAAGLVFVVTPALTKLPYDLKAATSVAEASGATFLQINNGSIKINNGDLRSTVRVNQLKDETAKLGGDLDGKAVVWQVGQTVDRVDNKELVSAYGAKLAMDRVSGEALKWQGQWLDDTGQRDTGIQFAGQIYKFPFNTEKRDYKIFDRDMRQVRDAKFSGTENIKGIETYRFEQVITDEQLTLDPSRLTPLLATFAPGATDAKLVYSNQRTVWVDPVTGSYIKVREVQKKVLTPNVGTPTTLLDADFTYNDATITASADRAKESRNSLRLISVYVPVGLAVLGLVLMIGGLLVARQGAVAAAGEARHRADVPPAPAPTRYDEPVVDEERPTAEQPAVDREGGPLSDEIPPASTNWRADDEPTVPTQRPASDEREKH
ncbi:DUF3068 domain-containing protein [Micromonospora sp. U56]|uniref:DUF3068 domain-containing protein n=1 Tax=Micromonospora sp. U56 TaxID=2824900 RepID=UPI001B381CF2|nr:DUF3068 domain-containing protein [Micromonospora sp. U56]MBQ0895323.1 DUF3068 domain-containing protein [Micromonospora sp. U56]